MGPSLALSYGTTLPIPYELILVDLARFERATSTFAESRSNSTELQVPNIFDLRLLIADLPLRKNNSRLRRPIANWHSEIGNGLAEG